MLSERHADSTPREAFGWNLGPHVIYAATEMLPACQLALEHHNHLICIHYCHVHFS